MNHILKYIKVLIVFFLLSFFVSCGSKTTLPHDPVVILPKVVEAPTTDKVENAIKEVDANIGRVNNSVDNIDHSIIRAKDLAEITEKISNEAFLVGLKAGSEESLRLKEVLKELIKKLKDSSVGIKEAKSHLINANNNIKSLREKVSDLKIDNKKLELNRDEWKNTALEEAEKVKKTKQIAQERDDAKLEVKEWQVKFEERGFYVKVFWWVIGSVILYLVLKIAKATPNFKPFLFWLP